MGGLLKRNSQMTIMILLLLMFLKGFYTMSEEVSGGHLFNNWIYGAKGLEYLQEGLFVIVGGKAVEYRDSRIRNITKGPLAQCNQCNSQNLLPDHVNSDNSCEKDKCRHKYQHKCFGNTKRDIRRKCPSGICSKLYDVIILDHFNRDPLFINTDPATWCTDRWSIAKCFENYQGPGKSAQDTDVSGLLSILINNNYMNNWFHCSRTKHPVHRAKYIRNEILHKPKLELDDKSLNNYIDIFISVLKCLESDKGDQSDAISKLQQLRKREHNYDNFEIMDVVRKMRMDFEKAINYKRLSSEHEQLVSAFGTVLPMLKRTEEILETKGKYPMPTISRPHDGRLIVLQNEQVNGLMSNCESEVVQGGFGVVGISKEKVPGLEVRVVIKRITCEGGDMIKSLSASKEKVASRTMHFAIVPLIAFMCKDISVGENEEEKSEFYFVSPYLERGNLSRMISKDNEDRKKGAGITLNQTGRLRILFQIASALNFLHSQVTGVRGIILHMDVKTTNIVLDDKLNARLIDFGLAREMNETQTEASYTKSINIGTPGYFPTVRYSTLTVHEDYYNFGVVIRELLTGDVPYKKSGKRVIELRHRSDFTVEQSLQKHIWKDDENALELLRLSTKCLDTSHKSVTSVDLDQIKTMYERSRVPSKRDLCMVNDAAPSKHHHHQCSVNVCVSCMRNSHVNPVKCPTCNEEVIPNIDHLPSKRLKLSRKGHTYASISIAGNDVKNKEAATPFSKEDKGIKDVFVSHTEKTMYDRSRVPSKCDLCMVNDAAPSKHHHHQCSVNVCVSCMRNSHVNPIKCPTCNEEVIPNIGHNYAAILIAGNDVKNKEAAKSFSKEIKEIKDVLVSKYPCVIGICDKNIEMVIPSVPGKEAELLPKCRSAFASLKSKSNLDTLLLYFTGHHSTENGFQLGGPKDNLTLEQLQEELKSISRAWGNTPRILAFLDCCYPQSVVPILNLSIDDLKVIQINAGRRFEKISQPLSGSHFQKFFIQALTRRVFNKRCHGNAINCPYCPISGDFIDVDQLLKYISQHMQNYIGGKEPVSYSDGITWNDKIVGYNIDFIVDLIFTLDLGSAEGKTVSIEKEVYCDMKMLKERIVQTVRSKYGVNGELTMTSVEFADALALRIQTGSQHGTELETVLKVSIAFDARREIIASYRTVDDILSGRVVSFMPSEFFSNYLSSYYKPDRITEFEGKEVAKFTLEELQNVIREPNLESGEEGKQFRNILLKVQEKWTYRKGDQQKKELQVIFPRRTKDERHEYFVMDLTD